MVKDLPYFLDEEDNFCRKHSDYGEMFWDPEIEEMSEIGINDQLNYLKDRIFSRTRDTIHEPLGRECDLGLTDAQRVLLRLLYCQHSYIFRDDYYYEGITDFVSNLFDSLDDLVRKAPVNTDPILYRYCVEYDMSEMVVGDVITIPHNLTCTNCEWGQEQTKNVYVITPLSPQETKAHNLFEIYNHGDENQVDFLRGSRFIVERIEDTEGTAYKKFYLREIL